MIFPEKIGKGIIGVTACSDGRTDEKDILRVQNAVKNWEARGYRVKLTKDCIGGDRGRSAETKIRAKELMELVTQKDVKSIIQVCGGDYLCEVLPYLDYERIRENPKWHQGFSDATGILYSVLTCTDQAVIYGGNFSDFGMECWHESLTENEKLLNGTAVSSDFSVRYTSFSKYQSGFTEKITGLEGFDLTDEVCWRGHDASGALVDRVTFTGRQIGGCLDVIMNLIGTPYEKTADFIKRYQSDKIVWCLETFEMGAAALTRALWQLKQAGYFEHASGFVFGRPTFFREDYGYSYTDAVLQSLGDLHVPIIFDACFGHRPPRIPLVLGAVATWECVKNKGSVCQKLD